MIKIGLEIHQQLEGKKLFCNCPTTLREDKTDVRFVRRLHASRGETGDVDSAAQLEAKKEKYFVYQGYRDTTCLVETDDEPPHGINPDALYTAYQVMKLLRCRPIDVVQCMRKTVIDGSNTSGFQRTALLGTKGSIPTSEGEVRIQSVCIEEEACKIIAQEESYVEYGLDRLGIPLIEIATEPDICSAKQAQEAAAYLGMVLRSTGRVKRGLGTIRQDINISINNGERIEIKGFQDLKTIPEIVQNEVRRQESLQNLSQTLPEVNASEIQNLTEQFQKSNSSIIKAAVESSGVVLVFKIAGWKGLIGKEISLHKRLGSEFSDYAKVEAGVKGIFHSDELPNYGITQEEVEIIQQTLGCQSQDAFVLVASNEVRAKKALLAVLERAKLCKKGVLPEVRRANEDASTSYMRPIPGASRMYPETDIPLLYPSFDHVAIPELLTDKAKNIEEQYSFSQDLAQTLVKSGKQELFEAIVAVCPAVKPAFIAETILSVDKQVKKLYGVDIAPTENDYTILFRALNAGEITTETIPLVLKENGAVKDGIEKFKQVSDEELKTGIEKVLQENKGAPMGALMGKVMEKFRGKADGKKIAEMVKGMVQGQ